MTIAIQRIALDVTKATTGTQWVRMGQGDLSGTTIVASIYDNGVSMNLSRMSAVFCMKMPGRKYHVRDENCTVSGNTITYVVDEETCCMIPGQTDLAYFEIRQGDTLIASTSRFKVNIRESVRHGENAYSYDPEMADAVREQFARFEQFINDRIGEGYDGAVLPVASTTRLGCVKIDGTTIGISNGVISVMDAVQYITNAKVIELTPYGDESGDYDPDEYGRLYVDSGEYLAMELSQGAIAAGLSVEVDDGVIRYPGTDIIDTILCLGDGGGAMSYVDANRVAYVPTFAMDGTTLAPTVSGHATIDSAGTASITFA